MRASSSFLFATALALSSTLFGCSSSDDGAGSTGDAATDASDASADARDTTPSPPTDTAGGGDTGTDAGCNAVMNIALAVTENNVAADLPVGTGGLIADGIYVVSAITRYNGPGGKVGPGTRVLEETIQIVDGKNIFGVRKVGTDLGYGYNAGIAPTGGTMLWKQTCPSGEPGVTYDFAVADQTFDIYDKVQKIGTTYRRKNLTP